MKELSIIIVSWNAREFLRACLQSIRETGQDIDHEIIVVDNASEDGSPEAVQRDFPEVILIQTGANLGFAAANNRGLSRAQGRYFCLINPDVVLQPDCLRVLLRFMDCNPDTGMAGPRLLNPDHTHQTSTTRHPGPLDSWKKALFLHRLAGRRRMDDPCIRDVPVLYGMFWIISRAAWSRVGGLDERFFMYGEDMDWCKRFHDHRFRVVYVPYATAFHEGAGSSRRVPVQMAIQLRQSRLLYFNKHHGCLPRLIDLSGLMAESLIRLVLGVLLVPLGVRDREWLTGYLSRHAVCLRWLIRRGGGFVFQRSGYPLA